VKQVDSGECDPLNILPNRSERAIRQGDGRDADLR